MKIRRSLVLSGAVAGLGLIGATSAVASGPPVSVRVEGVKRTLLPATVVRPGTGGSITKGGTPPGACPASSGAGALDLATKHRWGGTYSSGLGVEVTSILGETHKYSPSGYYWGIWVNNRYASAGVCDLKLHAGEQLLFAPYPGKGTTSAIVVSAPRTAKRGSSFRIDTYSYTAKGAEKPLAGASVTGRAVTNARGVATVKASKAGKLKLTVTRKGYIRAEATVAVT
ncbi:MAG: hypothetical protein WAL63_07565 [Solirubrobacteraceae bacterium]